MSDEQTSKFRTPCGRTTNSKGKPYTRQGYLNHIESCPECQRLLRDTQGLKPREIALDEDVMFYG